MALVDFIPDDLNRVRNENRINLICVLLFGVVMAAVVGGALYQQMIYRQLAAQSGDIDERYRQAGQQIAEIQRLEKDRTALIKKAEMAARLIQPVPRYRILASVSAAMPEGVALSQIKMTNEVVKKIDAASAVRNKFKNRSAEVKPAPAAGEAAAKKEDQPKITEVEILINGLAENDEQVAGFLTHLRKSEMFRNVELVYSQHNDRDGRILRAFQMTMKLDTNQPAADSLAMVTGAGGDITKTPGAVK